MPGSNLLTRLPHIVQWGDCDPAGIIYYPTYYRWMDAATWHLFAQAGYTAARIRGEHVSLPLVHAECSFVRSPTFGDACVVESTVAVFGGKSFTVQHRILREDGTELAHGREIRVWCRYENGPGSPLRGEPIPTALKALFAAPD
jgi:YbgC/YbaW family acyl-CoA thioester hydrolase